MMSDRISKYVLKLYCIIALCLPLFFLSFPDIIPLAKAYFLSKNHASGYVWFNGWEAATYVFQSTYFGAGVPTSEDHFRAAMSSELFDNLNLRGLGSLNAFNFGVFGIFYFIFFFWLIIQKQGDRNKTPLIILNVYLFMLMGRWAGIFNGTFLLVIALYLHSSSKLRYERSK